MRYYSGQGYSIDKIKQFLISNNIPPNDIDEAIAFVNSNQRSTVSPQSFLPQQQSFDNALEIQLRAYMQSQLNSGYNIELIKTTLMNRGYDPALVNRIASNISNVNINIKHEVHVSKGTIIGIITTIFIIGIIALGVLNMNIFNPKDSLLDISVSTPTYLYLSGEMVNYQIHVTNMGSQERFDATIKCLIVDDAGTIITRKEETIALETTASVNRNIQLPMNIKPGKYDLQIIADYGNKQAKSSTDIEVVQSASDKKPSTYVPPIINNDSSNTNSDIPSTPSYPTNPTTDPNYVYVQPTTPTASTGMSFGEIMTEVKQTAVYNPESAAVTCSKISTAEQIDICYSVVADSSKNVNYCNMIEDIKYRDNCYLSFLMNEGDVSVCDKMTDAENSEFCNQLKLIQLMDTYYKEGNSEKILELSKQLNPDIYGNTPEVQTYEHIYTEPITIIDIMGSGEIIDEEGVGENQEVLI